MPRIDAHEVETIAVIGAGTIGASWAAYFLSRGINVRVWDPDPHTESRVRGLVEDAWPCFKRLGMAAGAEIDRISFHDDPGAACRGADMVQENAPERLALKRDLLRTMETALSSDAVIASSTSYFPPTELQAEMRYPGRLALGHPFNPPHLIPLVEVLGGTKTDGVVVDWLMAFYAAIGRYPIRLHKEIPGHLVNRLQMALWDEAAKLVGEGIADAADVDAALVHGPGLRWAVMGPYLTMQLANAGGMAGAMDHFGPIAEHYANQEGQATLRHDPRVTKLIAEGIAERAAGRSVAELAKARDAMLTDILDVLAKYDR